MAIGGLSTATITYTDQGLKVVEDATRGTEGAVHGNRSERDGRRDLLYGRAVDRKKRKQVLYQDKEGEYDRIKVSLHRNK